MMPGTTTLQLAFHIDSPADSAELLRQQVAQISGVQSVETRALPPIRAIDAQSVAEVLVLITASTKTGVTVTSHLLEIIRNLKKIAHETGATRITIEHQRRLHNVDQLDTQEIEQLAENASTEN